MMKWTVSGLLLLSGMALAQPVEPASATHVERQAEAKARFAKADADGSGTLDKAEATVLGPRVAEHFDRIDRNGDGQLAQDELRKAARRAMQHGKLQAAVRRAYMKGLFQGLDDDRDGALTRGEIGDKAPKLAERFTQIDQNNDGKITRDELRESARETRGKAHRKSAA